MGIFGIENRTENWKTAHSFGPFISDADARHRLAQRLLEPVGKSVDCRPELVQLELFWNGVRDYLAALGGPRKTPERTSQFANVFANLFPNLREDIRQFGNMGQLDQISYDPTSEDGQESLWHNVHGTEIDVVASAPRYIFIGEAKHEGAFERYRNRTLAHQLVRQYVVVGILQEILAKSNGNERSTIVPFVVANEHELTKLRNDRQAEFMVAKGWLHPQNILSWDDIEKLASAT